MESNQPPNGADKEPEGPQQKKLKLERTTTLAAVATATANEGELTLVSSVDGGSVTVTMAAVAQSSTLDPDSGKLNVSEPVQVPSTAVAINKAVEWIQHEWHLKQAPLSEEAQATFISEFVVGLSKDCVVYVSVLKVAHFLALDGLVSAVLSTVSDDALHQACLDSFPPLASLVAPLGDLAEEEIAERLSRVMGLSDRVALLNAMITETGTSKLSWVQLEKCDGLYLKCDCDFDDSDVSDDESSDGENEKKKKKATEGSKPEDKTACLGLTAWTAAERERRQAQTDAAVAANKAARATYIVDLLTKEEAKEWAAMPPKPMKKHTDYDDGDDDGPYVYDEANDPAAVRRNELEEKTAAARGALDGELAEAVKADDLAAAQAAFAKGAALDLHEGEDPDDGDIVWLTTNDLPDRLEGDGESIETALPLICFVADNIRMVNWLLDNGADVNACQPDGIVGSEDYTAYEYGGATVLVFASTLEAVELLCARGANTRYTWSQPTVASAHSPGEGCDPKYELLTSDTQDGPIARCLVRHGAVVNTIYDPGEYGINDGSSSQDSGDDQMDEAAALTAARAAPGQRFGFGSYWKNVVMSGDITWAAELLAKYSANADWPSKCDCDFDVEEGSRYSDGLEERDHGDDYSTVLMVAIRRQDLPMVRLLLDHGAGVNKAKPNFANDEDESEDENDENDENDDEPKTLPLSVALETGNETIIELLKSKGAHE